MKKKSAIIIPPRAKSRYECTCQKCVNLKTSWLGYESCRAKRSMESPLVCPDFVKKGGGA